MTHLEHSHRPLDIRRRLAADHRPSYLPAAILGGIDGCVTTIAVIASVAGAGLPGIVAFVLGAANMVADGFSMAVSNYQAVKSEGDARDRLRRQEERHIDQMPEGERDEIRAIFEAKGFDGEALDGRQERRLHEVAAAATGGDRVHLRAGDVAGIGDGKGVEPGKKSLAIAVTLQPRQATLTDQEIEAVAARDERLNVGRLLRAGGEDRQPALDAAMRAEQPFDRGFRLARTSAAQGHHQTGNDDRPIGHGIVVEKGLRVHLAVEDGGTTRPCEHLHDRAG